MACLQYNLKHIIKRMTRKGNFLKDKKKLFENWIKTETNLIGNFIKTL